MFNKNLIIKVTKKIIKGVGCFKFHQVSTSDIIEKAPILVQNQEVKLVQSDEGKLSLRILLDVKELNLYEMWEVGVSYGFNSSEYLEPFDLAIIRVSSGEFIIRLSATFNKSNSNEYFYTIDFFSKFISVLPNQLEVLDMFYDLS